MRVLLCLLGVTLTLSVQAEGPADYLKAGKLAQRLEVLELQGGFAGFTGHYAIVEPDGSWTTGDVLPSERIGPAKAKGKLTADQLATLTKELAKHNLATLPKHGETETNPVVVRITFGKTVSELQPLPGTAKPEVDRAVRARYAGIVAAVKAACVGPK